MVSEIFNAEIELLILIEEKTEIDTSMLPPWKQ